MVTEAGAGQDEEDWASQCEVGSDARLIIRFTSYGKNRHEAAGHTSEDGEQCRQGAWQGRAWWRTKEDAA
ncbi:hypothetical protein E2C01_065065 [Portunus trituberculatus]|uniref:Uncharacterized protein n=1 Tax=Portunus trituberculatus TaxID=210409 RepID=A0A5B7HMH0_PORTR|nr:hypothetical protein [Portunus trituberculatus]